MLKHPEFSIDRLLVTGLHIATPSELIQFYSKNKEHLAHSAPIRASSFYTTDHWKKRIEDYFDEFNRRKALRFVILDQHQVIGTITFDKIFMGPWRAGFLGYAIDFDYQDRGIMRQAVSGSLKYIIEAWQLNRVMAAYMPDNKRSENLLRRLGFEQEGYARNYLLLNGRWQDHILTSFVSA